MRRFLAIAMLACSTLAAADVVYRWETVDANGATDSIFGRIVLADDVTGNVNYEYGCQPADACGDPDSPVLTLDFYTSSHFGAHIDFRGGTGFPDGQEARVITSLGPVLVSGLIGNDGTVSLFSMTGAGGLWTLDQLYTDTWHIAPTCWGDVCGGQTGRWVLAVPEPSSIALAALALLLAVAASRRTSSSRELGRARHVSGAAVLSVLGLLVASNVTAAPVTYVFSGTCLTRTTGGFGETAHDGPCLFPSFKGFIEMPDGYVPGTTFEAFNDGGPDTPRFTIHGLEPHISVDSNFWSSVLVSLPELSGPGSFSGVYDVYRYEIGGGEFSLFRETPFPGSTSITGTVSDFHRVAEPSSLALVALALIGWGVARRRTASASVTAGTLMSANRVTPITAASRYSSAL